MIRQVLRHSLHPGAVLLLLLAGLSAASATSRKELERAAELAVERAAEKVAERAAEKSLEAGNSTTLTVTVKEGYSNARRTAEESAAPGSESTRPGGSGAEFYRHEDYEDSGSREHKAPADSYNAESSREYSMETADEYSGPGEFESRRGGPGDFDAEFDFDFGTSSEYGMRKPGFEARKRSVEFGGAGAGRRRRGSEAEDAEEEGDEEEEDEIFRRYEGLSPAWSRTSQDGWTRVRPLWDDERHSGDSGEKRAERDDESEGDSGESPGDKQYSKRMSEGGKAPKKDELSFFSVAFDNKFEKALQNFRKSLGRQNKGGPPKVRESAERGEQDEGLADEDDDVPYLRPVTPRTSREEDAENDEPEDPVASEEATKSPTRVIPTPGPPTNRKTYKVEEIDLTEKKHQPSMRLQQNKGNGAIRLVQIKPALKKPRPKPAPLYDFFLPRNHRF